VATPLDFPLNTYGFSFTKRRHPGGGTNLTKIQTPSTGPFIYQTHFAYPQWSSVCAYIHCPSIEHIREEHLVCYLRIDDSVKTDMKLATKKTEYVKKINPTNLNKTIGR